MRSEQFLLRVSDEILSGSAVEKPKGSNRGPWVDKALNAAGAEPGLPWCSSGLYFCAQLTGLYKKPELPYPAAAVRSWVEFFKKKNRLFTDPSEVKRGDLGYWLDPKTLTGHIFAINEVKKLPLGIYWIRTSEFNGNPEGGREGYCGLKNVRYWKSGSAIKFIRFNDY